MIIIIIIIIIRGAHYPNLVEICVDFNWQMIIVILSLSFLLLSLS